MQYLIIGGYGFIGSHLTRRLAAEGHQVVVYGHRSHRSPVPSLPGVTYVEGELRDIPRLRSYLTGAPVVFHLAGSAAPQASVENPFHDLETNVTDTLYLLELCRAVPVARLIYVSSGGTVYGIPRTPVIAEDHPTDPISAYGINKLATEKYIAMYHHLYGLDYVIIRPANVYGEHQNVHRRQGAIGIFLHQIALGQEITIWGNGETTRDYIYVGDLVEALVRAAAAPLRQRLFNIGDNQGTTLNELLSLMRTVTGRTIAVHYEHARAVDVSVNILDSTRAYQELGWQPNIPLHEGLVRTWQWIEEFVREEVTHHGQ